MGNTGGKDILQEAANKSLDISHHLTPEQFTRHVGGECLEQCLLELPSEMYYNSVTLYENVDASFNFIGSIPTELSLHVPHLRHLNLSHNQLPSLPPSFQLLLHLRSLHLAYNRFKQFPSCLVRLPHLHSLDLSHNSIKDLPQHCWRHMPALEKLNISHNQLHLLPNALGVCGKMRVLVVDGNPLMHPPQQVCSEGSAAILSYLREQYIAKDKPKPVSSIGSPVFQRVRGDHVSGSVSNPESAWRQYQQGSYTAPGAKRKCPLMPPKDAAALPPQGLTHALMGLIYGAVVSEAVGLSCEGMSRSEAMFHYSPDALGPDTRVRDLLRCHYPAQDWGPQADLMMTTLETVLRWGGVVDELEWAAQAHHWTVHGLPDVDDRPGAPLSPLLNEVFSSEHYAVNPFSCAESLYRKLTLEPSAGLRRISSGTDSFALSSEKRNSSDGGDAPLLHVNDNSCLPAALVLGLPSFTQYSEVRSNADRISHASHAAPVPRAVAVFVATTVAAILQGRFESVMINPSMMETALQELFETAMLSVPDSLEKATLFKIWQGDILPVEAKLPSSHVGYTLFYVKKALIDYSKLVWGTERKSSLKKSAKPPIAPESNPSADDSSNMKCNENFENVIPDKRSLPRLMSDSELPSDYYNVSPTKYSSPPSITGEGPLRRSASLTQPPTVRIQLNDKPLAESSAAHCSTVTSIPAGRAREVYKRLVRDVCLQGGWGACSHACVVGGLLGMLGGYQRLPLDWLKQLAPSNLRYANAKINLLLDRFGLP